MKSRGILRIKKELALNFFPQSLLGLAENEPFSVYGSHSEFMVSFSQKYTFGGLKFFLKITTRHMNLNVPHPSTIPCFFWETPK